MNAGSFPTSSIQSRNLRTGLIALAAAIGMLGLGYAAVPLYRIFCQVTGFGGTTQRASLADADLASQLAQSAGSPTISVRFDGNIARDVPWSFGPEQATDTVQIGQRDMAFYIARNNSDKPITGTATFNVEPEQTGKYFNKVQCFCYRCSADNGGMCEHRINAPALDGTTCKRQRQRVDLVRHTRRVSYSGNSTSTNSASG